MIMNTRGEKRKIKNENHKKDKQILTYDELETGPTQLSCCYCLLDS